MQGQKCLVNAIKSAYQENETTMSKIILKSDGVAYYEKMSQNNCKVESIQGNWQEIIKEKAKRIGVSVNSYIITAFLQADRNNRVVGIPVSVRENGNKSMANLTSGICITHLYTDNDTFPTMSYEFQPLMRK